MPVAPARVGVAQMLRVGLLCLLVVACSRDAQESATGGQAVVDLDLLASLPAEPISFRDEVQPVLDRRCVVCHGCFDAPCQLKLSSYEGLTRGANKEQVYDGARIRAVEPTRLFIDAKSPAQWREKGFSPVLNEGESTAERNLEDSVLYRMLRLKQLNPQPKVAILPESFDLGLNRKQVCTQLDGFDKFAREHPRWGMPYAMPNLPDDEYALLVQWLAQGAPASEALASSAAVIDQIDEWEVFLNGASSKQQLMSRYIYEHLFQAHLHFAGSDAREFYRLVRSRTAPGQPVDEIPTVRPFDDPGTAPFYYRLLRYQPSIVAKDHVVYQWSPARMQRYRELFLAPDYEVAELPGYEQQLASNPLKSFAAIPPSSRYRFMLDEARFFINGFIKGPVCRGQVALNVIADQFWVVFFDPDRPTITEDPEFLNQVSDYLQMPAEWGNSTLRLLGVWTEYSKRQQAYMAAKEAKFATMHAEGMDDALGYIWDGEGHNPNAALTVFRHTDSAAVMYGLVGDYPETAWIIDYPLFERIHYLLVAGFDVYGNVGHQLNTRLYMDFLRMEGEDYFLSFLPAASRKPIRDQWYKGPRQHAKGLVDEPTEWLKTESVVGYRTDDPQRELYQHIETRLGPMAGPRDFVNRCTGAGCEDPAADAAQRRANEAMRRLTGLRGKHLQALSDLTFVRVRTGDEATSDLFYSLVLNKEYTNLSSIFADENERDIDNDTLTVVSGVAGMYPNFFFVVDIAGIDAFADAFVGIRTSADYERFVARYGMRRTNSDFWAEADWFQQQYSVIDPLEAGVLDLNRYRNR